MLEYARIFAYWTDMNLIERDGRTRRTHAHTDNPGSPASARTQRVRADASYVCADAPRVHADKVRLRGRWIASARTLDCVRTNTLIPLLPFP
jgi:hypothetical protein